MERISRMKQVYCFLIGLLMAMLIVSPILASGITPGNYVDIDAYIENRMASSRIPGISLVVAQGKEIVYRKGYGIAGPSRLMSADTPMFIGSQTKSFTALAIMQLVEAGQVDLDAALQSYIPWFQVADPLASTQITVRSLLNHSSGLSEAGYIPNLSHKTSLEQAVRDLRRARPTAAVGEKYQYFNPGYITLGYLVEVLSKQSYGEYLRQHVFTPLGMNHTSATIPEYAAMNIAQGYSQVFGFPLPMTQPVPAYYLQAGFIVSTAEDLSRYLIAMGNGGELDGQRILSPASIELMLTPNTTDGSIAGFGWDITRYYGEKQITHGGATEYFNTQVVILPESGLSVVMLINQDHMFKATYDYGPLFWGVVGLLTGHPLPQQQVSGVVIGYVVLVVFLFVLFFTGRGLLALRKERERLSGLPASRRWLSLLPHGIFILVILVVVTILGPFLAGRSFDLRWFIGFYPDVALLAGTALVAESIQALVKAVLILTLFPFRSASTFLLK
jgi:CubicO group peptidase (beta-lactamase class C family)